jgi:hypothetical protein
MWNEPDLVQIKTYQQLKATFPRFMELRMHGEDLYVPSLSADLELFRFWGANKLENEL